MLIMLMRAWLASTYTVFPINEKQYDKLHVQSKHSCREEGFDQVYISFSLAVLPPKVVNDTISNTPLMAVPLNVNPTQLGFDDYRDLISVCYEVQGSTRDIVNLVSTQCASIAARYAAPHRGSHQTLFNAIGIRSVDSMGMCHNIQVDNECSVLFDNQPITSNATSNNISIEMTPTSVVVTVPNCGKEIGVLVHCKNTLISSSGNQLPTNVMNITIIRGFGQQEESHGLIGMSPW